MQSDGIYRRYAPSVTCESFQEDLKCWFIFNGNKLLVQEIKNEVTVPFIQTPEEKGIHTVRTQYLGTFAGIQCYSSESEAQAPEDMDYRDLRSLYGLLEEDIFLLAGKAVQIVNWDKTHQYCGKCGARTEDLKGERAKICPVCGLVNYPRISPATITAVLKEDKILLAHGKSFRENMYSLIAGFVEPGETLEECVQREVMEETGIRIKNIRYLASQPWPFPNSLMLGFCADYDSGEICVDGTEISDAQWFDIRNLPALPSKISIARRIIDWYIQKQEAFE